MQQGKRINIQTSSSLNNYSHEFKFTCGLGMDTTGKFTPLYGDRLSFILNSDYLKTFQKINVKIADHNFGKLINKENKISELVMEVCTFNQAVKKEAIAQSMVKNESKLKTSFKQLFCATTMNKVTLQVQNAALIDNTKLGFIFTCESKEDKDQYDKWIEVLGVELVNGDLFLPIIYLKHGEFEVKKIVEILDALGELIDDIPKIQVTIGNLYYQWYSTHIDYVCKRHLFNL